MNKKKSNKHQRPKNKTIIRRMMRKKMSQTLLLIKKLAMEQLKKTKILLKRKIKQIIVDLV